MSGKPIVESWWVNQCFVASWAMLFGELTNILEIIWLLWIWRISFGELVFVELTITQYKWAIFCPLYIYIFICRKPVTVFTFDVEIKEKHLHYEIIDKSFAHLHSRKLDDLFPVKLSRSGECDMVTFDYVKQSKEVDHFFTLKD